MLLLRLLFRLIKNIVLWLDYNDTYIRIQRNPRLRGHMQGDPGVAFMRRGWIIVAIILAAISIYGGMP